MDKSGEKRPTTGSNEKKITKAAVQWSDDLLADPYNSETRGSKLRSYRTGNNDNCRNITSEYTCTVSYILSYMTAMHSE